jgi:hypothetical protein
MKIADTIKHQIEGKLCPVHDMHPVVETAGDEINVACCCNYFEHYCKIEIEYIKSQIKPLNNPVYGIYGFRWLNSV